MEKKISVVIPTFQRAELLKKCLVALAMQDFNKDDFEIIVVSDGPDHATRNMLNEVHLHLPFVQYIALSKNSGPAAARNAGWRAANGQLIAFTDDDCLPAPSWLVNIWNAFVALNFPKYVAFTGKVTVPLPEVPTDYQRNTSHLETADFVTANCACSREALELIDGFDERFRYAWREDSDLEFRLMEHQVNINRRIDAVVVHPVRDAAWGVSIREQRKTMFNALLFKKFPSLFRKKIQATPAWNYYATVGGFIILVAGLGLQNKTAIIAGGLLYSALTLEFIRRRLANTSRSSDHVMEMVSTSMVIPFLSIYWTLYGSVKYRVLYY